MSNKKRRIVISLSNDSRLNSKCLIFHYGGPDYLKNAIISYYRKSSHDLSLQHQKSVNFVYKLSERKIKQSGFFLTEII